jgi:hypothetical protein
MGGRVRDLRRRQQEEPFHAGIEDMMVSTPALKISRSI